MACGSQFKGVLGQWMWLSHNGDPSGTMLESGSDSVSP